DRSPRIKHRRSLMFQGYTAGESFNRFLASFEATSARKIEERTMAVNPAHTPLHLFPSCFLPRRHNTSPDLANEWRFRSQFGPFFNGLIGRLSLPAGRPLFVEPVYGQLICFRNTII